MIYTGWLLYTEEDAEKNDSFINELIVEAREQQIELTLKLQHEIEINSNTPNIDFVWNRTRDEKVAHYFEKHHIRVFNSSFVNKLANNKWLSYLFAKEMGIPCIPTWREMPQNVQFPVVVKSVSGHGGREVAICHSYEEVNHYIKLFGLNTSIIQPYIKSNSQDIRIWVLGDRILGSVVRTGNNSFKSNYTLGGSIARFNIPIELSNIIQSIVKKIKSDYIGIDFIPTIDGQFYLNELEDPVGARSFYNLYETNLSKTLITYIRKSVEGK